MQARDWFSVAVRVLGVWVIFCGFEQLFAFANLWFTPQEDPMFRPESRQMAQATVYLWYAGGYWVLGSFMLFGAEPLTRLAFREPLPPQPVSTADEDIAEV